VYTVTNIEGTNLLISIFDKYNLNSTKSQDYFKYKEALLTYIKRNELENQLSSAARFIQEPMSGFLYKTLSKVELTNKLVELKDSMNTKRINTTMPINHKIVITKSWLLGYLDFFILNKKSS
jgi:hypothetical protein